uniref:Uncharacterized protein n=1 Tax=Solanum lycopersicum TaxID=4081 RepID=A0A3Q7HDN6_SOLLC
MVIVNFVSMQHVKQHQKAKKGYQKNYYHNQMMNYSYFPFATLKNLLNMLSIHFLHHHLFPYQYYYSRMNYLDLNP